jgi:hypothetical protein
MMNEQDAMAAAAQPDTTNTMDLPPALASLLNTSALTAPQMAPGAGIGGAAGMAGQVAPMPSFQEGGMIGPGGMPIRPGAGGAPGLAQPGAPAGEVSSQQLQMEAQRFVQQNPQQFQQIQMALQQAIQSGEVTPQELNTVVQMATVALQNPEMYPQLRAMAIQQGLATEQDLSPQYDRGLLFVLLLVGQSMQGGMGAVAPGQQPMRSMAKGGALPQKSANADGSIPIKAHEGEYVIPANVVRMKGVEFFDKLVQQYNGEAKK